MSKNNGGPAFPAMHFDLAENERGMTLRDYFAAKASDADVKDQGEILREKLVNSGQISILPDGWRVTARYMHADAMLKAREA